MSAAKWKDESCFSQGTVDRTPTTWTLDTGMYVRITVTRHIHHAPDAWVLVCHDLRIDSKLKSKGIDEAKAEAVRFVTARLTAMIKSLPKVKP